MNIFLMNIKFFIKNELSTKKFNKFLSYLILNIPTPSTPQIIAKLATPSTTFQMLFAMNRRSLSKFLLPSLPRFRCCEIRLFFSCKSCRHFLTRNSAKKAANARISPQLQITNVPTTLMNGIGSPADRAWLWCSLARQRSYRACWVDV